MAWSFNMKRSEMIKLILDVCSYHDGAYMEPYIADSLLNAIENAGMLPPFQYGELDRKTVPPTRDYQIGAFEWEEENETKKG